MSDLYRLLAPLARRVSNLLARGSVVAADGARKLRTLQVRLLADESVEGVEHFEPYGYTAEPLPGAEVLAGFFDGDRSHGAVICVADRRYRLRGLAAGEVAIYDDQDQKVHLTRDGIVVSTPKALRLEAADIVMHASASWSWDVAGYGERWTALGGNAWEHKTWQTGATVTELPLAINPPEGP